jgi:DNA-binding MarR family transcriptional regulator
MTGYKDELEQAKRQSVAQLLFRTSRILNEHAIARFRESTGLPLRVAHTRLFPLIDLEGTRLTELAKRLGVRKQATNQWVDELLQMGMLEKRADPTDRRARLICFSEQGQMGILAGLSFLKELEKELCQEVGEEVVESLHIGLLALNDMLEKWGEAGEP